MPRYIDADKLEEHFKDSVSKYNLSINDNVYPVFLVDHTLHEIRNTPTADVKEVKHGYWINIPPYKAMNGHYNKAQECSVCRSYFVSDGNSPYLNHPFCSECGSTMDGESKETGVFPSHLADKGVKK